MGWYIMSDNIVFTKSVYWKRSTSFDYRYKRLLFACISLKVMIMKETTDATLLTFLISSTLNPIDSCPTHPLLSSNLLKSWPSKIELKLRLPNDCYGNECWQVLNLGIRACDQLADEEGTPTNLPFFGIFLKGSTSISFHKLMSVELYPSRM